MKDVLIIFDVDEPSLVGIVQKLIEGNGGHVLQSYGQKVLVVEIPDELEVAISTQRGVLGVYPGNVPSEISGLLDEPGKLGVLAWNERNSSDFKAAKRHRKGDTLSWDHPDYEPEG